jgi:hypothetical protein
MPHVFPITQSCRVFTHKAFDSFVQGARYPEYGGALSAWTALVVGECLVQRGDTLDFSSLSLNACLATFSYAAGRAKGLWGDEFDDASSFGAKAELLATQIEKAPRRLRTRDLIPAWYALLKLSSGNPEHATPYGPGFDVVLRVVRNLSESGELSPSDTSELAQFFPPARNLELLPRASAETRVRIFDDILATVTPSMSSENQIASFTVGCAALSVGGGNTEHIKLLEPLRNSMPMAIVWFCLLSGLMRERIWDRSFAGIARIVSREFAYSFNSCDAPRADISRNEAMFLIGEDDGNSTFKDIRRAQQRALSVELLPGVCLVASLFEKDRASRLPPEIAAYAHREKAAISSLEKIEQSVGLLWEVRSTLQEIVGGRPKPPTVQPERKTSGNDRSRRPKKGTGSSGSLI